MLLYVLELINQIAKDKNKDIGTYSVEFEFLNVLKRIK